MAIFRKTSRSDGDKSLGSLIHATENIPSDKSAKPLAILAFIGITSAVFMRIYFSLSSLGRLDSDEAITLLMGRKIGNGKPVVFFLGQNYGGSQEAFLMAPLVKIFNMHTWIARVVPCFVTLIAAIVLMYGFSYVKGKNRVRDPFLWAGVFFLNIPASLVWWSVHSSGFYAMVMASGIISFSLGKTLSDKDVPSTARFRSWVSRHRGTGFVLLGISIGCGWWASPQSMMFIIPLGIWMLPHIKEIFAKIVYLISGFVLGSLPWIVANIHSHLKSLDTGQFPASTYLHRLKTFFVDGLPTLFNFRSWLAPRTQFFGPRHALIVVACIIFASLCLVGAKEIISKFSSPVSLFAIALITYPVISSINPNSFYVGEARYQWFVIPSMCVVLCSIPKFIEIRTVVTVFLIASIGSSMFAMFRVIDGYNDNLKFSSPSNFGPVVHKIERLHMNSVAADYWTAYRLTAESQDKVIATPFDASMRIPQDQLHVEKDLDGIVASSFTGENQQASLYLKTNKISFHLYTYGNISIYKFTRPLTKTQIHEIVTPALLRKNIERNAGY